MDKQRLQALLPRIIELAKCAGEAILEVVHDSDDLNIEKKADNSPVTRADIAAHDVIAAGLKGIAPEIPVISEEGKHLPFTERKCWEYCWLVDPLDGTKGFIDGSGEYTVNIALIHGHESILGVFYSPHFGECYSAAKGLGAFLEAKDDSKKAINAAVYTDDRDINIAVSQYHRSKWLGNLLSEFKGYYLVRMNSSIKIGFVASGVADIYPRLGPTSEWDTAAGHCIVTEAGGKVVDLYGQNLQYNARETLVNPGFVVLGDVHQMPRYLEIIQRVKGESK